MLAPSGLKKTKRLIFAALTLASAPASASEVRSREVNLSAVATASVQAGSSSNRNLLDYWANVQGAPTQAMSSVQVKDLGDPGFWRKAYLNFSLSGLSPANAKTDSPMAEKISESEFQLTAIDSEEGRIDPETIWEFRVSGICHSQINPWVESSSGSRAPAAITWNNAPANQRADSRETRGAAALDAFFLKGKGLGTAGIATPRLTEFLQGCLEQHGKSVTFIIARSSPQRSQGQDYVHAFASRNATEPEQRPMLKLTLVKDVRQRLVSNSVGQQDPQTALQSMARAGLLDLEISR